MVERAILGAREGADHILPQPVGGVSGNRGSPLLILSFQMVMAGVVCWSGLIKNGEEGHIQNSVWSKSGSGKTSKASIKLDFIARDSLVLQ